MPVASNTPLLEHYALPGGRIGGFQNGLAIAGDFMSAATILGMSAIIFSAGFDVVIYLAAPMAAFPIVILLVTDKLKELGLGLSTLSALSLGLTLCFGLAGSPHILIRFVTVPDAAAARLSAGVGPRRHRDRQPRDLLRGRRRRGRPGEGQPRLPRPVRVSSRRRGWMAPVSATKEAMSGDAAAKRPATYQDVLDAPADMIAEIVAGTLHTQPRPSMPHALASSALAIELGASFARRTGVHRGWWIIDKPELHLGENILVPDLAGWRRARMPAFPETPFATLAPDWVCEVLSPSTRRVDLHEKRPAYAREGVAHLWLLDPIDHALEAFALADGHWTLIAAAQDDAPVSIPPFEASTFSLGELWPRACMGH